MEQNLQKVKKEYSQFEKEYNSTLLKIKNIEDKLVNLHTEIEDDKKTLKESAQNSVEKLTSIIYKKETEYNSLKNELRPLKIEKRFYLENLEQRQQQIATISKEICQKALLMNAKNSYRIKLNKTTKTTRIITEFCKNVDYEFLILDADMHLSNYRTFSYIITRENTIITESVYNIPTMTEIKSVSGRSICNIDIPRMQFLKKHILEVTQNISTFKTNQIIPLSEPCPIGGQSNSNQEGYGWNWDWSYGYGDCYVGTFYGEMTGFNVIGIRINESDYYF